MGARLLHSTVWFLTAQRPSREVKKAEIEAAFSLPRLASQHGVFHHSRGVFFYFSQKYHLSPI